jgi:hypothetical protein
MSNKKYKLDEFAAADGQSEVPDPGAGGSAARSADRSEGEASFSDSTKAEVMAKIMHDLQNRSPKEVKDIFKALSQGDTSRPADGGGEGENYSGVNPGTSSLGAFGDARKSFGNSGETYDAVNPGSSVKPVVAREHIEEIFTGQELSEELLDRAAVVYEAAVNSRIAIVEARLEEQYTTALQEAIDLIHEEVVQSVDKYMTYVANEWVEENRLAVENGLKAEMAEDLLLSLKEAFESNYITVSEEKVDVMENMANEIEELKSRLNSEFEARLNLENSLEAYKVSELVGDMSEGMTAVEKDKFLSLIEKISYSNLDDFSSKVEVLKETYFSGGAPRYTSAEPLVEDYDYNAEPEREVPSNMRAYSEALTRIAKK